MVWISTQRLRGSENGKTFLFGYGNGNNGREKQRTTRVFSAFCRSLFLSPFLLLQPKKVFVVAVL
jgi:hypothetical protein